MRFFQIAIVALCLGLLAAIPFIISLPNPVTAQREAAVRPQTAVERQIAAARGTAGDNHIRPEIGNVLGSAVELTNNGKYKQGLAEIDGLQSNPNKTAYEAWVIGQVRQSLIVKARELTEDRQTR